MKITHISAGRDRSVVLSSEGAAYGWGSVKLLGATLPPGYPGELCTGNPTEIGHNRYAQPVPQALNPGVPFSAISDGYIDILGVRRDGHMLSCRPVVSAEKGALSTEVAGLPPHASQVVLTESAGFALYADGAVWSWGLPAYGQLGRQLPAAAEGAVQQHRSVRIAHPAPIAGLEPVAALAAGQGHVLALGRSGKVWAWGANSAGQLGNGNLKESAQPQRVVLPARIVRVAAGDTHSFAVDALGRAWGWGSNNFGQIGQLRDAAQTAAYYAQPQRIKTGFPVAQIDAGMFYSVATSTQGEVFAWGWNGMGQMGQGDMASSAKPVRLRQLSNVTRLAAGVSHVLALNDQGVFAWGDNRSSACGEFPSVAVQRQPLRINLA